MFYVYLVFSENISFGTCQITEEKRFSEFSIEVAFFKLYFYINWEGKTQFVHFRIVISSWNRSWGVALAIQFQG